jgi:hypothetical protein
VNATHCIVHLAKALTAVVLMYNVRVVVAARTAYLLHGRKSYAGIRRHERFVIEII